MSEKDLISNFLDSIQNADEDVNDFIGMSLGEVAEHLHVTMKFDMWTVAFVAGWEESEWEDFIITTEDVKEFLS